MNIFHILLLLASKEIKGKHKKCLYNHLQSLKQNCNIKKKIIEWKKDENKFSIVIYCLGENINVNKEMKLSNKLYKKHGLWWTVFDPLEIKKIMSIKKIYDPTFIFSFNKQKPESFFSLL